MSPLVPFEESKAAVYVVKQILGAIAGLRERTARKPSERFDLWLAPLFTNLQRVHSNYNQVFRQTVWEARAAHDGAATPISPAAAVEMLVESFCQRADLLDSLKDFVRARAKDFIVPLDTPEERRFLFLVIAYFHMDVGGQSLTADELDNRIGELLRVGGTAYLDTPAHRLVANLRRANTLQMALEMAIDAADSAGQRFSDVTDALNALDLAVHKAIL